MTLDLNVPEEITLEAVSEFLCSVDDSVHRQIRVTKGGIAFLSDTIGNQHIEGLAFRVETFCEGNDCVESDAAKDSQWVERVRNVLVNNWPQPRATYIDQY